MNSGEQGSGGVAEASAPAAGTPAVTSVATSSPKRWRGPAVAEVLSRYSLIVVLAALWLLFSLWNPQVFATTANLQTILLVQASVALIALAVMVPLVAGHFDLSSGFQFGLAQSLCAILVIQKGWNPLLAILAVLGVGGLIGLVNGQLITRLNLPSFTTTLGTGLVILGLSEFLTDNQVIAGAAPDWFLALGRGSLAGIPLPFLYLALIGIALFVMLELAVWGRRAYAVGANPVAARLSGIAVDKLVRQSFVITGLLCALAGCISVTSLGGSSPVIGFGSLLPAFAGAFLGATCIRPGRYNVAGTVIAVYVIGVGIIGLQQNGANVYVQDLFNGGALLVAVIVATLARRRRTAS
ncbi:ABC transporter permease [Pseudonocardia xishanensis]|uniref:Autoinducer 2 import system permease protein LsrD n=1 Tax=Pseudonocardia xishanensis TaxID=630995 RepID=A0ABP8RV63_9PSEU